MTVLALIGAAVGGVAGWFLGGMTWAMYGAAVGFGIGMALDPIRPDVEQPGKPQIAQFSLSTASEGVPIADFLGTTKLTGNIFQYGNNRSEEIVEEVESSGGKGFGGGGSQSYTKGYKYYLTWAMGLGCGEVDMLYTIYAGDNCVWEGELARPGSGGKESLTVCDMGSMTFYFGTSDQAADSTLGALLSDSTLNPAYRNLSYVVFNDCYIGDYNRAPVMKFVIRKTPLYDWTENEIIETFWYNPACAIYYILTEKIGIDAAYIDATGSFADVADALFYENRGITILMDRQQEALSYLRSILEHVDANLFWGSDGKLHLKLIRADMSVEHMPEVDETVMLDDFQMQRKSWIDTVNEIKVQYPLMYLGGEACGATVSEDAGSDGFDVLMVSCLGNDATGKVTIINGEPPFTFKICIGEVGSCTWATVMTTYSRTPTFSCEQVVCYESQAIARHFRVVDKQGRQTMMHDINIVYRDDLEITNTASLDMIEPEGSIDVVLGGGKAGYLVSVSGEHHWLDSGYTIKEMTTEDSTVTVYKDAEGGAETSTITVTDYCGGVAGVEIKCECPGPDAVALAADEDTNPETIARSSSVTVAVLGGCAPFLWSVSGTGFSLGNAETIGRSNSLVASGSACGAALITVNDYCGNTVSFYVRCETGTWVSKSSSVQIDGVGVLVSGAFPCNVSNCVYRLIDGNKKQEQTIASCAASYPPGECDGGLFQERCEAGICGGGGWTCGGSHSIFPYELCKCNAYIDSNGHCFIQSSGSSPYYEWEC